MACYFLTWLLKSGQLITPIQDIQTHSIIKDLSDLQEGLEH